MTNQFRSIPHAPHSGENYLESTVQSASPARLRLMVIEKAVGVAGLLSEQWREGKALGSNEHSIKLLDLFNELLSGVVGGGGGVQEQEVCLKVADLYVFLSQHLLAAETSSDAGAIDEIRTVLEVEAETWRAVCAQANPILASEILGQPGLNLQA